MELENQDNIYLKKALKYFLKLKENEDKDSKGTIFASKSISYLRKIKNKTKYQNVIIETEDYCNNYIKLSAVPSKTKKLNYEEIFNLIKKGDLKGFEKVNIDPNDLTKNNEEGITPTFMC